MNYNKIAEILDAAAKQAKATKQISLDHPIDLNAAYAVQSISVARRYIRGEKLVGLKLGFTSKAKMIQMGVDDMIWGRLTDHMAYPPGGKLQKSRFIHPRAEPEIAFRINQRIKSNFTLENAKQVISGIATAIEIIDSRYENFKFSLEDVVADNCSSAGFVIGDWMPIDTPINDINMSLNIDGEIKHEGNSNAILGNPWESLVAAIRLALENGEILEEGSIVLAGAATPASFIEVGQLIEVNADGFSPISLNVI